MNTKLLSRGIIFLILFTFLGCKENLRSMNKILFSNEIIFVRDAFGFPEHEIWAMDSNGKNQVKILRKPSSIYSISWSPNRKKIAFGYVKKNICELRILEIDQREKTIYKGDIRSVSFSPSGDKIAFVSEYPNQIYIIDSNNRRNLKKLTDSIKSSYNPSWSPDGKKIAFEMDGIIYIIGSNGENLKQITEEGSPSRAPSLSPDGKKIVFQCVIEENWKIFMMNVNGTNIERVTNSPTYIEERSSIWSPDGKLIVFQEENTEKVKIEERRCVVLINLETKERKKLISLSPSLYFISSMCFSPDSKKIALEVTDISTHKKYGYGNNEIYTIDIDGKNLKNLTNTPHWDESYPFWRPIVK